MKIEKHCGLPSYPSSAQFAASAKLLGLATMASLGVLPTMANETAPSDPKSPAAVSKEHEKPIDCDSECDSAGNIPDFMLEEGIHDYEYDGYPYMSLKEIVKMFYQDGFADAKHHGKILPFDVDVCSKLVLAANPALKLDSKGKLVSAKPQGEDAPLLKLLVPQVYKKIKEIHSAADLKNMTHDYQYVTKSGDTLKTLVDSFYKEGSKGQAPDWKDIPLDSAAACKKVAAANPALKLDSFENPLPVGTKLLLPKVYKPYSSH
jgi:hypothetical protein